MERKVEVDVSDMFYKTSFMRVDDWKVHNCTDSFFFVA